jgi:hypothetical protein
LHVDKKSDVATGREPHRGHLDEVAAGHGSKLFVIVRQWLGKPPCLRNWLLRQVGDLQRDIALVAGAPVLAV